MEANPLIFWASYMYLTIGAASAMWLQVSKRFREWGVANMLLLGFGWPVAILIVICSRIPELHKQDMRLRSMLPEPPIIPIIINEVTQVMSSPIPTWCQHCGAGVVSASNICAYCGSAVGG